MAYELSEQKKVGLGLLGFGILFSFLGVVLFFDRGLLALGNVFWLTGVALLLGWSSMWNVFTNKENIKAKLTGKHFGDAYFFCHDLSHVDRCLLFLAKKTMIDACGFCIFSSWSLFPFVRWPILGIILELYGCLVLFGGFWPTVKVFLCEVPFLGWVIRYIFW
ncbi:hypothetical protein M0R45_019911 [Rubus argutus]|uniref:Vesicle transport protein n=1 Tax=Rubus argutus TaxID=59490 RepID=A0AAW1X6T5_RUBAR